MLSLSLAEREWVVGSFLPQLNGAIAGAAQFNLGSDHLLDASDAFAGHPICSSDPYVNGFTLGDDLIGVLGNESFHPNVSGHARLEQLAQAKWGATLGAVPERRARGRRPSGSRRCRTSRRGERDARGPGARRDRSAGLRHRARCT